MEPAATSFLVARDPPSPKTAHLRRRQEQGPVQTGLGWACSAFVQALCFLLASGFTWGLRRAGCDLWLAVSTTCFLVALCACLWKLELLRRDPGANPASTARERRRVGLAASAVSLALVSLVALQVASVAPSLALKVALWVLAGVALGLAIYFLFAAIRARAQDVGRWSDLHELSPQQRV